MTKTAFVIAAPASGTGKTTIARGLMALLTGKGLRVQPFKCGPDYIDTKFHETVCRRPSVNLDTFMASPQHVQNTFARYGADADVCIVEGMMGLFDGYDRDHGSTAEIAQVLGLPVVLVVDAKAAAYSTAALLTGFIRFRQGVNIVGVIFNRVGSERHFQMLQQVCADLGVACLGYLPKQSELEQGSRYLGLDFSEEADSQKLTRLLGEHIRWQHLLEISHIEYDKCPTVGDRRLTAGRTVVARNQEAFSFIYQEALDTLYHPEFFDPEREVPHLGDCALLYLPGGYPEKHAEALAANKEARQAISDYAERGGHIIAECGGMMYLCRSIITDDGEYPMCGVLPYSITARKADRRLTLGYRQFSLNGRTFRGHEFHYTQFADGIPISACQVYNAKGEPVTTPVLRQKNVFASYTHIYPHYETDIH